MMIMIILRILLTNHSITNTNTNTKHNTTHNDTSTNQRTGRGPQYTILLYHIIVFVCCISVHDIICVI